MAKRSSGDQQERAAKLRQFVEDMGVLYADQNVPRMAGRIIGRLLVSTPAHQSLNDLSTYLNASMGSVSTTTRFLEQIGMIERTSIPGERKVQFRLNVNTFSALVDGHLAHIRNMRQLAQQGLELIGPDADPSRREHLEEMLDIASLYEHRFPELQTKWAQESARRTTRMS